MSNEAALAQYQKQYDEDEFESIFIEEFCIEQIETLTADIQAMLKAKGYSNDIIEFFDDIGAYDRLDKIFTEMAKDAYRSRNEREP